MIKLIKAGAGKARQFVKSNASSAKLALAVGACAVAGSAHAADGDVPAVITTGILTVTNTFTAVTTLAITVGVFFIGWRLVKRAAK
jgi:hypothetical protein